MLGLKTILHPTDFGESSAYALDLACGLASDYRASLVIMHVVAAPVVLCDGVIFPSHDCDVEGIREKLDELEIPMQPMEVTRRVEEGDPAAEILNIAQICHADLIVMGSHGRDGLRRWLMGSVAEAVMRQATCPVLTVTTHIGSHAPPVGNRPSSPKPMSRLNA